MFYSVILQNYAKNIYNFIDRKTILIEFAKNDRTNAFTHKGIQKCSNVSDCKSKQAYVGPTK